MSRDGLLPPLFGRVHPRFKTPYVTTALTGVVVALVAGLFPIATLTQLTAMGTLLVIHLGVVAGLFITLPYGKFAHVVYRYAALVRYAIEQRRI